MNDSTSVALSCGYCGVIVSVGAQDDSKLHHDHIVPRSRGGGDTADNCVVSCRRCNLEKHDRTPSEWRPAGLPEWIYEVERTLVARFKMKQRGRREKRPGPADVEIIVPGLRLLKANYPLCVDSECRRSATYEVGFDGWAAYCHRCARSWHPKHVRKISGDVRWCAHLLIQLAPRGVLHDQLQHESSLAILARLGGVSLDDYVDLAWRVLTGDAVLREAIKASAPSLRLEIWQPVASGEQ